MPMRITPEGKRLVASLDFALQLKEAVAQEHASGTSDKEGTAFTLLLVAWALAGRDSNHPPQDEELPELLNFMNSHAAEINAAAAVCLENLVNHDCGATKH